MSGLIEKLLSEQVNIYKVLDILRNHVSTCEHVLNKARAVGTRMDIKIAEARLKECNSIFTDFNNLINPKDRAI